MVAPKLRADSWAALLTPEQQWALYDYHYQVAKGKWELSAAWAVKEFELAKGPSRAAFYNWKDPMDDLEKVRHQEIRTIADQRIEEAARNIEVADPKIQRALMAEAMSRAMVEKDPEAAKKFIDMTTSLIRAVSDQKELELRGREVDLKTAAERRKDEELALAREKFEYDAAKKAMAFAAEIKTVSADDSLDDDEKIAKVRQALFG